MAFSVIVKVLRKLHIENGYDFLYIKYFIKT